MLTQTVKLRGVTMELNMGDNGRWRSTSGVQDHSLSRVWGQCIFCHQIMGETSNHVPLATPLGRLEKMIWASVGVGCSCIARPIAHLQFLYRWRFMPKSDPLESYFFVVSVQKFILLNLYCQTFFIYFRHNFTSLPPKFNKQMTSSPSNDTWKTRMDHFMTFLWINPMVPG